MSLHNSTRETRKWIILLVTTVETQAALRSASPTNSKPSASGFEFEEEKSPSREQNIVRCFAESAWRTSTTGQAKQSARGMPWHQEPMKDVISCDKLRGAANEL